MHSSLKLTVVLCLSALLAEGGDSVTRIYRPARYTRGETNLTRVQPADRVSWVWHPEFVKTPQHGDVNVYLRFRNVFRSDGSPLVFDVTADNRYILLLDGEIVSRGPNRGDVNNWQYQTYRADRIQTDYLAVSTTGGILKPVDVKGTLVLLG